MLGVPQEVLQELLLLVSKAGLKPGLLLLDRGFYSVAVIRYLQRARRPFLMPVVCHGRKADHPKGPAGRTSSSRRRRAGGSATPSRTAEGQGHGLDLREAGRWVDRHGRRKSDTWVYAYWGITPRWVDWVKESRNNLAFSGWETIFKDPMTTAAAIDRLVHHSVILELNVPSYRAEQAKKAGQKPSGSADPSKEV